MSRRKVAEIHFSKKHEIFEGVNLIGTNKNLATIHIEKHGMSEVQAAIIVNGSEHYFSNLNPLITSKINNTTITPYLCNVLQPEARVSIGDFNFTYIITEKYSLKNNQNLAISNSIHISNGKVCDTDLFEDDDDFIPPTQFETQMEENTNKNIMNTAIDETWVDEVDVSDLELANINVNLERKSIRSNDVESLQGKSDIKPSPLQNSRNSKDIKCNIAEDKKWVFEQDTEWIDDSEKLNKSMRQNSIENNASNQIPIRSTESFNDLQTQLILDPKNYDKSDSNSIGQKINDSINKDELLETQFDLNCINDQSLQKSFDHNEKIVDLKKKNVAAEFNDSETQFDFIVPENSKENDSKTHESSLYLKIYRESMTEYSQEIGTRKSIKGKKCPVIEDSDSDDSIILTQYIGEFKNSNTISNRCIEIIESSDEDIFENEINAGNDFQINTPDLLEAGTSAIDKQNQSKSSTLADNDSTIQIFDVTTQIIDVDNIESPKNTVEIQSEPRSKLRDNKNNIDIFDISTQIIDADSIKTPNKNIISKNSIQCKSIFDTPINAKPVVNYLNKEPSKQSPVSSKLKKEDDDIFDVTTQIFDDDVISVKNKIESDREKNNQPKSALKNIFNAPKIKDDLNKSFDIFNAATQLPDDMISASALRLKEENPQTLLPNLDDETPRFDSPLDISIVGHNNIENPKEVKTSENNLPIQVIKKEDTKEIVIKPCSSDIVKNSNSTPQFKPKLLLTDENVNDDENLFQRPQVQRSFVSQHLKKIIDNDEMKENVKNLNIFDALTQIIDNTEENNSKNKTALAKNKTQDVTSESDHILTQIIEKNRLDCDNDNIDDMLTQIIENDHPEKNTPTISLVKTNTIKKSIDWGTSFIQITSSNSNTNCDINLEESDDLTQFIDETDPRQNVSKSSIQNNVNDGNSDEDLTQFIDEKDVRQSGTESSIQNNKNISDNNFDEDLTQLVNEKEVVKEAISNVTEVLIQNIEDSNNEDLTQYIDKKEFPRQDLTRTEKLIQKKEKESNDVPDDDFTHLIDDGNVNMQDLDNPTEDEEATQIIESNVDLVNASTQLIDESDKIKIKVPTSNNDKPSTHKTAPKTSLNSIENLPNTTKSKKENNKRSSNCEDPATLSKKNKLSLKNVQNENEHKYNTRSKTRNK